MESVMTETSETQNAVRPAVEPSQEKPNVATADKRAMKIRLKTGVAGGRVVAVHL